MGKQGSPESVDELAFEPQPFTRMVRGKLALAISALSRHIEARRDVVEIGKWDDPFPNLPPALVGRGEAVKDWLPKVLSALVLAHQTYQRHVGKDATRDIVAALRACGVEAAETYGQFPFPDPAVELIAVAVIEKNPGHPKAPLDPQMTISILGSSAEGAEKVERAMVRTSKLIFAHTSSGEDNESPAFVRTTSVAGAAIGFAFTVQTIPHVVFVATAPESFIKEATRAFRRGGVIDMVE